MDGARAGRRIQTHRLRVAHHQPIHNRRRNSVRARDQHLLRIRFRLALRIDKRHPHRTRHNRPPNGNHRERARKTGRNLRTRLGRIPSRRIRLRRDGKLDGTVNITNHRMRIRSHRNHRNRHIQPNPKAPPNASVIRPKNDGYASGSLSK